MHMPDGILPLSHIIVYLIFSVIMISISIWQSRKSLTMKQIPIVGVLAAGLFAAQMFNFPVPFGSSGHLIGTALATSLVGPWVAILILSSILIVQAMFGDGGFLAFGANALNMAIVGAFSTFLLFFVIPSKWRQKKEFFAIIAGITGFISTILMALFAATELSIAQVGPPGLIFGWMMSLHGIIGLIEGFITFTIVMFIFKADTSLFEMAEDSLYLRASVEEEKMPEYKFPIWATVATVAVFGVMSIFGIIASENPDGLERTFERLEEVGINLFPKDSGFLSFGEGLGYAILQMAAVMIILFLIILAVSYLVYRVRLTRYRKSQEEVSLETQEGPSFDSQEEEEASNFEQQQEEETEEAEASVEVKSEQ